MKASITNVNTNPASPVRPQLQPIQFNSANNFSPINSFQENTVTNQYGNNPGIGLEFLPPPEMITNGNNPNYNIIFNPAVNNPNIIPINPNPVAIQYTISPQPPMSRPIHQPIQTPPNIQYNTLSGVKMSRSKFTPQEDATLKELVAKYGSTKWSEIAMKLPNRTGRQCRERWKNYLAPGIQNGPWSPEEDALLVQKVKELGTMWSKMVPFFPGRTDVNLKNRWVTLRYKKNNNVNNDDDNINNKNSKNHSNNENDDDDDNNENDDDEKNSSSNLLLTNVNSSSNNSIPVYPNYVNYGQYYNYPSIQLNPPPNFGPYYNNANQIEYKQPDLQIHQGDTITFRQLPSFNSDILFGTYTDIGTETEHHEHNNSSNDNDRNDSNSPEIFNRKNSPPKLEPSIILSQPRWLLNHRSSDVSLPDQNPDAHDEKNDKKKKDLNEPSKINLNASSFQQNSQPHDRLEVPLLVAMPLGSSS